MNGIANITTPTWLKITGAVIGGLFIISLFSGGEQTMDEPVNEDKSSLKGLRNSKGCIEL